MPAQPDTYTAGQVTLGIFGRVPNIHNLTVCVTHSKDLVQINRLKGLFQSLVQRGMFSSIENRIVGEIRRCVRLVRRNECNELLFRHRLQSVIETTLIPERRHRIGGKIFAA